MKGFTQALFGATMLATSAAAAVDRIMVKVCLDQKKVNRDWTPTDLKKGFALLLRYERLAILHEGCCISTYGNHTSKKGDLNLIHFLQRTSAAMAPSLARVDHTRTHWRTQPLVHAMFHIYKPSGRMLSVSTLSTRHKTTMLV